MTLSGDHSKYQVGPTVHTKTYQVYIYLFLLKNIWPYLLPGIGLLFPGDVDVSYCVINV